MYNSRHLITISDHLPLTYDEPLILLGEWCKPHTKKLITDQVDVIVAPPYGIRKDQKDIDNNYTRALENKLFPNVCLLLNRFHGLEYSERYWRIVFGNWFSRVINVLFNRISTLGQCLALYNISCVSIYKADNYSLSPRDTSASTLAFEDNYWNNLIDGEILKLMGKQHLIKYCSRSYSQGSPMLSAADYTSDIMGKTIVRSSQSLRSIFSRLLTLASRNTDAFISSTYLTKSEFVKLNLLYRQVPQLWLSPDFKLNISPNLKSRKLLGDKLKVESLDQVERFVSSLLFQVMPICFLEGYSQISDCAARLPWPSRPKFIFTSNRFDTDELFKFWSASKVETGVKYFIGAHGNYGVMRHRYNPSNEELVSDKFLTWGWTDGLPQHYPAFIFKTSGLKSQGYDCNGGLLLIQNCVPHRVHTYDSTFEFKQYFCDQQEFCCKLSDFILDKLTIRLHSEFKSKFWNDEVRWFEFNPKINIDDGSMPIRKLWSQQRLVVHSYDSTGILETLSLNIPTLVFWRNELDHLRNSAKPHYQKLIDAGILHLSVDSITDQINNIWNDVDQWWFSRKIQNARLEFCHRYARTVDQPAKELKQILDKKYFFHHSVDSSKSK